MHCKIKDAHTRSWYLGNRKYIKVQKGKTDQLQDSDEESKINTNKKEATGGGI